MILCSTRFIFLFYVNVNSVEIAHNHWFVLPVNSMQHDQDNAQSAQKSVSTQHCSNPTYTHDGLPSYLYSPHNIISGHAINSYFCFQTFHIIIMSKLTCLPYNRASYSQICYYVAKNLQLYLWVQFLERACLSSIMGVDRVHFLIPYSLQFLSLLSPGSPQNSTIGIPACTNIPVTSLRTPNGN